MRKVTCLVMVCLLVSVLALASGALAISKAKIVNTEWQITGSVKSYDAETGEYVGSSVGGIGIAKITATDIIGTIAPMVGSQSGVAQVIVGATAVWEVEYTKEGDILRGTTGSVFVSHPAIGTIEDYVGDITFKLTFLTDTSFKIKLKYINPPGVKNVVKAVGKKLGQLPEEVEPQ